MLMTIITDDDIFEDCDVVGPTFLLDDDDDDDEGEVVIPGNVPMDNEVVLEEDAIPEQEHQVVDLSPTNQASSETLQL